MITIPISGIIDQYQYDSESNNTPDALRKSLNEANGDDVLITINTPGGSVFYGFEMFSLISNYKGKTETRIVSLAASMGSLLALAGQKKSIENTAIFFIHNAQGIAIGDYRKMEEEGKWLRDISGVISEIYSKKTNLSKEKAQKLMDEETSFYGKDLAELGFEVVDVGEPTTPATARILAMPKLQAWKERIKPEDYLKDLEKAVALIGRDTHSILHVDRNQIDEHIDGQASEPPASGANHRTEDKRMDLNELQANNPDVYAQAVQAGIEKERKRVSAHITLGEGCGDISIALKHIKSGASSIDEDVQAEYMTARMKGKEAQARRDDNPADTDTDTASASSEDKPLDESALLNRVNALSKRKGDK